MSESSREEATWVLPVPSPCVSPALSPFHLRREPSSFLSFLICDPKLGLLLRLESADILAVACRASHLRPGIARGLGGPFSSESLSCGLEQRVRCLEDKIVVWPWWGGLLGDPWRVCPPLCSECKFQICSVSFRCHSRPPPSCPRSLGFPPVHPQLPVVEWPVRRPSVAGPWGEPGTPALYCSPV